MTRSTINEYGKQKQRIRNFIVEALRQLNKPSQTKEIVIKINELMILDTRRQFADKAYILGNLEKDKANYSKKDLTKIQTNKMIDKRTVQRRLSELVNEGLLEIKDYYFYALTDKVKHNVKYHAPNFGGFALANIMAMHRPMLFPLEENVKKLIEMFGVYLIYCLVECARPAVIEEEKEGKKSIDMISEHQANLTMKFVENVFNPMNLYSYFLSTFQYQPTDKEASNNLKRFGEDNSKHGPSIQDLDIERFNLMTGSYAGDRRSRQELNELYMLNVERVKNITHVLKKVYPELYSRLSEARASFLGVPKQLSQYQKDMVALGSFGTDEDTGEEETTVIHRITKKKSLSKPRKLKT